MEDGGLRALGCGEQARGDRATHAAHARSLAQGRDGVACELERVDTENDVEDPIGERKRLHLGLVQVGSRQPLARDLEEPRSDVDAAHQRAALGGQHERQPRAAPDIEEPRSWSDAGGLEERLEQRSVVALGEVGPGPGIGSPEAPLHLGGGASSRHSSSPATATRR